MLSSGIFSAVIERRRKGQPFPLEIEDPELQYNVTGVMRLLSIGFALMLLPACAAGVFEDFELDAGTARDARTSGSGGSSNTSGSGSSGGSTNSGGSSSGGSGGSGATGATGGTGGAAGRGGSGGTAGAAGRGGTAGASGTGGMGGTGVDAGGGTGPMGCMGTPDWTMGTAYAAGDKVRAVCGTADGAAGTMCVVGKTYTFSCSLALACGLLQPGMPMWGFAWMLGMQCN